MFKRFINWWKPTNTVPENLKENHQLYGTVFLSWYSGFTVSSDHARTNAPVVAMAATLGLITTREPDGSFGRAWHVTPAGMGFLENYWVGEP